MNVMAPPGEMPTSPFRSVIFVGAKKLTVKTKTLRHLATDFSTVNDDPGRRVFLLKVRRHVLINFFLGGAYWNGAELKKHKINPRNYNSTNSHLKNTIQVTQMLLFKAVS